MRCKTTLDLWLQYKTATKFDRISSLATETINLKFKTTDCDNSVQSQIAQ